MKPTDLDSIVLGTPRPTGDDWYFSPRPSEGLDDAEVAIVSMPVRPAKTQQTPHRTRPVAGSR